VSVRGCGCNSCVYHNNGTILPGPWRANSVGGGQAALPTLSFIMGDAEEQQSKVARRAPPPARIAVIGAGWWAQGWHLPHLQRNIDAELVAVVERSERPVAAAFLKLTLESRTEVAAKYGVPMYNTVEDLLADEEVLAKVDGVIICTPHACHAEMGSAFLTAGKHVLMEKPMTTDVAEARALALQATAAPKLAFMVNNTANVRSPTSPPTTPQNVDMERLRACERRRRRTI
jgi:hypothetical protein